MEAGNPLGRMEPPGTTPVSPGLRRKQWKTVENRETEEGEDGGSRLASTDVSRRERVAPY